MKKSPATVRPLVQALSSRQKACLAILLVSELMIALPLLWLAVRHAHGLPGLTCPVLVLVFHRLFAEVPLWVVERD